MCGICECACLGCFGVCAGAVFLVTFYFFFGIIFLTLAMKARAAVSLYSDLITYDVSLFPTLCIVIGILFTFLTFMGAIGQQKGRKTRIAYSLAQVAVLLLGLYIYIDAYPNEAKLEKHLFQGLNSTIHDYGLDVVAGEKSITDSWDQMQQNLKCCGVKNYMDWEDIRPHGPQSPPTPQSCCLEDHRMTGCSLHVRFDHPAEANKIIHVQGCLMAVREELLGTMQALHWFLIPILIMVCIGIIVSTCSSGVRKNTEMEEKKVGPIIIKMKVRKTEPTSYDVEAAEKGNLGDNNDEEKDVEMQKLNPDGRNKSDGED